MPIQGRRGGDHKTGNVPETHYSAGVAARLLGVSKTTLGVYVERGKIVQMTPPGKKNRVYERASVDAFAREVQEYTLALIGKSTRPPAATYRQATPEDVAGIYGVLTSFGWPTSSVQQRLSYLRKNPSLYFVVKVRNLVIGYISMFPHPPEIIEEQMAGRMRGRDIQPRHILPFEPGTYECFTGIAVRQAGIPKTVARWYAARLVEHFLLYLIDLAEKHSIFIRRLYGTSDEEEGQKMAEQIGFARLPTVEGDIILNPEHAHPAPAQRYVLDMETSMAGRAVQYREAVARIHERIGEPLSIQEAERRVWNAVDELEEVINGTNGTPGKRDKERRDEMASLLMSLLAEKYGTAPPDRG